MTITLEPSTMTPARRGGAVKLLRMAKVHCRAALAMTATVQADGSVARCSYPEVSTEPAAPSSTWSAEPVAPVAWSTEPVAPLTWSDEQVASVLRAAWRELPVNDDGVAVGCVAIAAADGSSTLCSVAAVRSTGAAVPQSVFGVVRDDPAEYSVQELTALRTLARRYLDYLQARGEVLGAPQTDQVPAMAGPSVTVPEPAPAVVGQMPAVPPQPSAAPDQPPAVPDQSDPLAQFPLVGELAAHLDRLRSAEPPVRPAVAVVDVAWAAEPADAVASATTIATTVRKGVRRGDVAARVGRSTFAVALELPPDATDALATTIATRLAHAVRAALAGVPGSTVRSAAAVDVPAAAGVGKTASIEPLQRAWARLVAP